MKKLEKVFLVLYVIVTLLLIIGSAELIVTLFFYGILVFAYIFANAIRDVKERKENNQNMTGRQSYNSAGNTLYTGMNGKPVTLWKFIVGAILLVGGVILALLQVL